MGWIVICIILWVLIMVCCLALCKASGEADKHANKQYLEYIKSQNQDNNINQNNKGE